MARLTSDQRATLLGLAAKSINQGLDQGPRLCVDSGDYPAPLQAMRACFVTLHLQAKLRGCVGTLEPEKTLVEAVVDAAHNAAFADCRFTPLSAREAAEIDIDISVLSLPTRLTISSEAQLLAELRPGVDGLIISEGHHRATFLPTVWQQLPNPADFLAELKHKAGFTADYWSDNMQVSRYTTENFPTPDAE